jgi:hypothetical protein
MKYQFSFVSSLFCIADNQCSNFALFSINIVEFEMTADRLIFSSRSIALIFVVISAMWFMSDEDDAYEEMIDSRTLRVRFWAVSRIFNLSLRARIIYLSSSLRDVNDAFDSRCAQNKFDMNISRQQMKRKKSSHEKKKSNFVKHFDFSSTRRLSFDV